MAFATCATDLCVGNLRLGSLGDRLSRLQGLVGRAPNPAGRAGTIHIPRDYPADASGQTYIIFYGIKYQRAVSPAGTDFVYVFALRYCQ